MQLKLWTRAYIGRMKPHVRDGEGKRDIKEKEMTNENKTERRERERASSV